MDQAPIKIGQYVLGKNLGIGAFGKVSLFQLSVISNQLSVSVSVSDAL